MPTMTTTTTTTTMTYESQSKQINCKRLGKARIIINWLKIAAAAAVKVALTAAAALVSISFTKDSESERRLTFISHLIYSLSQVHNGV